jgi:phage-related protein
VKKEREIIFYGEHFVQYYLALPGRLQEKIEYIFKLIKTVERIPEKFLKHIEGTAGLFEIRIEFSGNAHRIFCCFDGGSLVVLFNAFQKKTQKTPAREIDLAERLMKEYFEQKGKK